MFVRYEWCATNENGKITIIDSEFKEIIHPSMLDGALGGLNYMLYNIVKVYEKRKLNVAANIILYLNFLPKNISINEWLGMFKEEFYDRKLYDYVFDKYGKDIEKYLLLI
jgi:hypothetical protein